MILSNAMSLFLGYYTKMATLMMTKQCRECSIASNMKFGFLGKSRVLIMNMKSEFRDRSPFLN
jgi:hypothetical protein